MMLPAETIRIGALLNFVPGKRRGDDPRARLHFHLMDRRADRRREKLLDAAKRHRRFRERYALDARHFVVRRQQQIELALERNLKRIFDVGILPGVLIGLDRAPFRRRGVWPAPMLWRWPRPRRRRRRFPPASGGRWKRIPSDPCAITRMPMPNDSDSASVPTWPFFVERSRRRMSMTRASA